MRLVYLSPFPLLREPTGPWWPEVKSWTGVREYQRWWPGDVVFASPGHRVHPGGPVPSGHVQDDGTGPSIVEVPPFDDPEGQVRALSRLGPSVVLTLMNYQARHLVDRLPVALTVEHDFAIRRGIALASGPVHSRSRALVGLLRREPAYRRMARSATGLQCNGPAATRAYGPLAQNVLSYMDHRLTAADVESARDIPAWDGRRPLRLAFSGRWTAIKGPRFVLEAARLLDVSLPGARIAMLGAGELEEELRSTAPGNVDFVGYLDFETQWRDYVRQRVDLMILPHVQGDPSCTYFESLGSGAPVVGFHNGTLTPLARDDGAAVAVRRGDAAALAEAVACLAQDPVRYAAMRDAGLSLVGRQPWETLSQRRVEHLVDVAASVLATSG